MTVAERLAASHQQSVGLYLKRTQVEEQKQMLQAQANQLMQQGRMIDLELAKLDGKIEELTAMQAEEQKAGNG